MGSPAMASPIELSQTILSSIIVHVRTTDGIGISSFTIVESPAISIFTPLCLFTGLMARTLPCLGHGLDFPKDILGDQLHDIDRWLRFGNLAPWCNHLFRAPRRNADELLADETFGTNRDDRVLWQLDPRVDP